jgi:hypothetical protein
MAETYTEVASKYELRDPKGFWRAVLVTYVIAIGMYVAMAINEAAVWAMYSQLIFFAPEQAAIFDQVMGALSIAVAPTYVVCAICTLLLLYRLVANAHARGTEEKLTGPGMAVGSYFIPFVSLIMPPLIMGQLWRATFGTDEAARKPQGAIGFWWTAFLMGNFIATYVGGVTGGMFSSAPPQLPADPRGLLALSGFGFVCRLAAAGTLLWIFGTLVKRQRPDETADVFT